MKKPPLPPNEQDRLEELRSLDILDTPPEERFDRLTRMAKRIFDVPIALVSLVDETRQWFKSCVGLSVSETSRDISFCGHSILGDDVFVVDDALEDERFKDNPLVLGHPFIRFYAGCPLRLCKNKKMGTLCIIDVRPRDFNSDDIRLLEDLAAMVENEVNALHLATIDALTRVSNRRGFGILAEKSLNYCRRNTLPASLAFFDINGLKAINDNFGHREGDKVISVFSKLMISNMRDSDIIARIGGDEFVAFFANTKKKETEVCISNFHKSLSEYSKVSPIDYDLNFSYGIVEFDPMRHTAMEILLDDGDYLMYQCKRKMKKEKMG